MTQPTTISIDNTQYVRADSVPTPTGPPPEHRIVVADRGWIFVGACKTEDDGAITISNARCIRYWGTDNDKPGLGWLAQNGPTSKTKLDSSGVVRVPCHAVVLTLDTSADLWV